jgi:hypothetical protein
MIEVLEDMPGGVVGVEAVVFVAGERFTGFSSGAMWDDVKWGTSHAKGWGRIAPVTDVGWMRHLTKAFSWLAPKGMKVFPTSELDAAKAWAAG